MQETSSPIPVNLFDFLREQLVGFGIKLRSDRAADPPIIAAVVFDFAGFTVTCPISAWQPAQSFLQASFGAPHFDETDTAIYRNDACFTTVMLAQQDSETKVFVMHWKDEGVRRTIEESQAAALEKVVDDEIVEIEQLFEEAAQGGSEAEAKFNAAITRCASYGGN